MKALLESCEGFKGVNFKGGNSVFEGSMRFYTLGLRFLRRKKILQQLERRLRRFVLSVYDLDRLGIRGSEM